MNLVVVEDAVAVAREAAARVLGAARLALAARGAFNLALSGGSTPKRLYRRLADLAAAEGFDWGAVHLFFGDERCVPPQHADSNYGMVKATLLDRIAIPDANVHRMHGEAPLPEAAAIAYEEELRRPLDLAILGIGADGHTASLFPRTAALAETTRVCVAVPVPALRTTRLTLTHVVWAETRDVLFLVTGTEKAEALHDVMYGPPRPRDVPAQTVARRPGPVTILADRGAAARLPAPASD